MKLLHKTSIYFFISALIVFLIGNAIFYFLVKREINTEIDETLVFQKDKIMEHVKNEKSLPDFNSIYGLDAIIKPAGEIKNGHTIKDTLLFNELKNENLPYRILTFTCKVNNQYYQLQLLKSFFEVDDLIKGIVTFMVLLILFLLLTLFVINTFIFQKTLSPFYKILQKLKQYDITKNNHLDLGNPKTYEFIQLKNEILAMTDKASNDFLQQKEFIEHSSHEIQTPLAIIKQECELMLQSENNSKHQIRSISTISESANRLSKLNHALILITKIKNKQFQTNEIIDIQDCIEKHIANFEELISLKNITLTTSFEQKPLLKINPALADILISNLLTNAIKHNIEGGEISIKLTKQELIISNTGTTLSIDPNILFQRFFKDNSNSGSLGLGLTIVKKITDLYQMDIAYTYNKKTHSIAIKF